MKSSDENPLLSHAELALWREFQEGLGSLLGVSVDLCDYDGRSLTNATQDNNPFCQAVMSSSEGARKRCNEHRASLVKRAVEHRQNFISKCHVNQYVFSVPIAVGAEKPFVVLGGRAYLSGNESKDFHDGVSSLGFDSRSLEVIKSLLQTIEPKAVFTLPGAINRVATPVLKGLCHRTGATRAEGNGDGLKGFHRLNRVCEAIASVLEKDELYSTIIEKSTELVEAERGSLMMVDPDGPSLSVKAMKGKNVEPLREAKVRLGEGIAGTVAKDGRPIVVRDIEAEVPGRKNQAVYRTKSFICIPIKADANVIGVLNASDKAEGEHFTDEDMHMLQSFGNYASIALERGAYYSMSEELKRLSMTDALTGLYNRRHFRERLMEETERVRRHGGAYSVFMIDIDNFKGVNDTYGHHMGDEVLRHVSQAIKDAVRTVDVTARYGGEEFAVLLPNTSKSGAVVIAERMRRLVELYRPEGMQTGKLPTISLGVAEFPVDAEGADEVLGKADSAMYLAKRMGKNRVVVYER